MGVSTDAILIYGVQLSDYDEQPYSKLPWAHEDDEEFEDYLLRRIGGRQYPVEGWIDDKLKAQEKFPFTLVRHCSYEYPMWILGLKNTHLEGSRGYPETFTLLPEVKEDEVKQLKDFLKEFGIDEESEWVLCSMWG